MAEVEPLFLQAFVICLQTIPEDSKITTIILIASSEPEWCVYIQLLLCRKQTLTNDRNNYWNILILCRKIIICHYGHSDNQDKLKMDRNFNLQLPPTLMQTTFAEDSSTLYPLVTPKMAT